MAGRLRGNNSNTTAAANLLNPRFQYTADVSNQPPLCRNLPAEFHTDPVNYGGNTHPSTYSLLPNKQVWDAEAILRQKNLQFSINKRTFNNEIDRKTGLLNPNPVCTGLRLSYDDDDGRNSSLTSASGSLTSAVFPSLTNETLQELDQQREEFDRFIRSQAENLAKGLREIKQRHTASLLKNLEKTVLTKLQEKNVELENVTSRNKELVESVKHLTAEAQSWSYMAKHNESMVTALKTNLQQAMQQKSNRAREGVGDSHVDDAESCIDPNNYLSSSAVGSRKCKHNVICRLCNGNEASILVMPCRHLCLCRECRHFVSECPACQTTTTSSLEVYLS
ncbi:E3 ubiquitin-protein ligase BOI-like [Andrographis paniculata]|uniref:E3 ubiquitin-protein ligase BOI-like n=1 Tax=Andrographis paniculata TaxID=175694 RepID=UPI0021E715E1|nr:E3 ubiquitin-protein ligase BOI-like [Andrographis paniculata]XP_051116583.1 E3 ubiquitin-protein ligase BOI-like [Andrographis paniculata]